MNIHEPLRGSCSCGRNQYLIRIPEDATVQAKIYFDTSHCSRRLHGTPLTAWLRVPLDWYQSHTQSYFPDETHTSIRRTFVPQSAPHTQRVFCGFCGTPLTSWTEDPLEESSYMSVTVGSLTGDHQRVLDDLHLLPEESDDETLDEDKEEILRPFPPAEVMLTSGNGSNMSKRYQWGDIRGTPWFEEMIEGSRLGRLLKAKRRMSASDDQTTTVEWEVTEVRYDGLNQQTLATSSPSSSITGKRKQESQPETRETRFSV